MLRVKYLPPTYLFPELTNQATTLRNGKNLCFMSTRGVNLGLESGHKHH